MDTTKMADDVVLPGHAYSLGEMRAMIHLLRKLNDDFYWTLFRAGVGARIHAFVEFCGLQAKFIDFCKGALDQGIEFPMANQHANVSWPMDTHHAEYLGEKFKCIFGFAMTDPTVRDAFVAAAFGPKETKAEAAE